MLLIAGFFFILFSGFSGACVPTRSPDDLPEITTTTTISTTTPTTTTTPDNSACQLCPNLPTCGGADCPASYYCDPVTATPVRGVAGCSITFTCTTGVPHYKDAATGMWDVGQSPGNVMCGDFPNNQWRDPNGAVITATCCG